MPRTVKRIGIPEMFLKAFHCWQLIHIILALHFMPAPDEILSSGVPNGPSQCYLLVYVSAVN